MVAERIDIKVNMTFSRLIYMTFIEMGGIPLSMHRLLRTETADDCYIKTTNTFDKMLGHKIF